MIVFSIPPNPRFYFVLVESLIGEDPSIKVVIDQSEEKVCLRI
jgi:hypothetical protein